MPTSSQAKYAAHCIPLFRTVKELFRSSKSPCHHEASFTGWEHIPHVFLASVVDVQRVELEFTAHFPEEANSLPAWLDKMEFLRRTSDGQDDAGQTCPRAYVHDLRKLPSPE